MKRPILKILTESGCQSYLVACPTTRQALLVDPKAGQVATIDHLVQAYGLRLIAVLDTHTHADHLSASSVYTDRGLPLWMSHRTTCKREHRGLRHGDPVEVGELRFEVREVPGHTPDSMVLYGHGLVLAGDTLLAGGLARADFHGSDPALLFESVQSQIMTLPDDTLVLPGHGYLDILFTTVGTERSRNRALQHADGAAYAAQLNAVEGRGNTPEVDATLKLNLEREPILPESPANVAACCSSGGAPDGMERPEETTPEALQDRRAALTESGSWVDVRDPYEFEESHIPGTRNLPLSELGFHLDELRNQNPLILNCRSGVRSVTAARTLQYLGAVEAAVSVAGGILRWEELSYPVQGAAAADH